MSWNGFNEIAPVVRSAQAKKRPSCPPESEEQKALFDWWQRTPYARHFVMYHIPNGGRRDKITGARLKAEGVVAGVPDVFLASPRQGFHGLYIEMKRQRGGTVQDTQKELRGTASRSARAGGRRGKPSKTI